MNKPVTKFYDLRNLEACMGDFRYVYSPFSKTHYKFRQDGCNYWQVEPSREKK